MLYSEDVIPVMGHLISSLLLIIEKEKLIKLRIAAIECLLQISSLTEDEDVKTPCKSNNLAMILFEISIMKEFLRK